MHTFNDVRQLRSRRGETLFTIAPHPFYLLGGSIGKRLLDQIDCFDAIELCHFRKGFFSPNRRAIKVAKSWQTVGCNFRRSSAQCVWPTLYHHTTAVVGNGRVYIRSASGGPHRH